MKRTTAIIGAQWGDEGKGKLADRLGLQADWVIRYQGGNNAGHTVVVDGEKYVLHLIPSGILHDDTTCLIGPGMVVNLRELIDEIDTLKEADIPVEERLRIACRAHVLFPYHKFIDSKNEEQRGDDKIGTTQKGIGPAYEDKVKREGFRFVDFGSFDRLCRQCRKKIERLPEGWDGFESISPEELAEEYMGYYERIQPLLVDGPFELESAYNRDQILLFEGAQGTLLDLDFGSYPFVTSSNSSVGGVATGGGFPGHRLDSVIGVTKAYLTRVGEGPFPAELVGDMGEWLREQGEEYGATTGRPRRCGWLDLPLLNYSTRVNGFTSLALTKLDVLSGLDTIKVTVDHHRTDTGPQDVSVHSSSLKSVEAVYETLPGWDESIGDCRSWSDLPLKARDYVNFVEEFVNVPVNYISIGPGREELILKD